MSSTRPSSRRTLIARPASRRPSPGAAALAFVVALAAVPASAADRRPRAEIHGYPWLSVTAPYSADPAASTLRAGIPGLEPRSLAAGDVDQDGVPDLVVGYATGRGGAVAVFRGNVDALHPNAPEAQANRAAGRAVDSPFLPAPAIHEVAETADFVATGDFDADGRWDVASASRGGSKLLWLRGLEQGGLGEAEPVALSGEVTAFAAGEVNRRDGLTDLVVAVSGRGGDGALVFEGPGGALRAKPERIALPAQATDLAIGRLDDDGYLDVVAATGTRLTVVRGRDRKVSLDEAARRAVPPPELRSVASPFVVASVTIGEFEGGYGTEPEIAALARDGDVQILSRGGDADRFAAVRRIASGGRALANGRVLVTTQLSTVAMDEALVLDGNGRALRLVEPVSDPRSPAKGGASTSVLPDAGAPVAALAMRLNKHALSSLVVLRSGDPTPVTIEAAPTAIYTIDTTADTGDANLNDGLCVDANGHCSLHAAKDQANFLAGLQEFDFAIPGPDPTINYGGDLFETVTIDGTTQPGYDGTPIVAISFSCNCAAFAIGGGGAASNSSVRGLLFNGGLTPAIAFIPASNNIIEANWIGLDRTGQAASSPANTHGIVGYGGANNRIGGTVAAARNVISGNAGMGYTTNPSSQVVQGNYIGVSADGLRAVGNGREGIEGVDTLMTIGGTTAGAGNVIAANAVSNGNGQISIGNPSGDPDALLIQGNLIGTDRTGTVALGGGGSAAGVRGHSLQGTTIGGTSPAARNVIAGQGGNGVEFHGGATDFLVQGNLIGLAVDGATPLGNGGNGVFVSGGGGTIGGSALGAPNKVAFNGGTGLCVPSPATVRFQQNSIYSNAQIGIDLNSGGSCNGVTTNDGGDGDGGANGQLNFPSITSVAGTNVQGTFSSTAAVASYTLEFFSSPSCDASGNGEGKTFRGSAVVNTDASGNGTFDATLASGIPTGQAVTATATDANGNTSEFSGCTTAGGSTAVELDDVTQPLEVGSTVTLTGGGFTPGTVLKIFVGTANGPLDVLPEGLAPSAVTATSWTATLPFPWPIAAPNDTALGEGYAALQLVRTDNGYDSSNLVPAVLLGNPALLQPVPSITAIDGIPLLKGSLGAPVSFVDGVAENTTVTLTGTGFSNAVVNLFTEAGNLGPITPDAQTATSIELTLPPSTPVGPGSFQVVNTPSFRTSNAVAVQLLEPVFVQLAVIGDPTATVVGKGLNSLTVIQIFVVGFFFPDGGGVLPYSEKFGGLDGNGSPIIPLTVQDSHTATFPRSALAFPPNGTFLGAGWVEAINPPYVGETAKWGVAIGF